jgi:hypothetical protein
MRAAIVLAIVALLIAGAGLACGGVYILFGLGWTLLGAGAVVVSIALVLLRGLGE